MSSQPFSLALWYPSGHPNEGQPHSGAIVELRVGANVYSGDELGTTGRYSWASIPRGRYWLWVNGSETGETYSVGDGELAALEYDNEKVLKSASSSILWGDVTGIDHQTLLNLDLPGHPLEAIIGLTDALNEKVDRSGDTMTGNLIVSVGGQSTVISGGTIQLSLSPDDSGTTPGILRWNALDQCPEWTLQNGSVGQVFQENHIRMLIETPMAEGTVVSIAGSQGQRAVGEKTDVSDTMSSFSSIGMLTQTVDNAITYATTFGLVRGANTDGIAEGTTVWMSETPGIYSATPAAKPNYQIQVGTVIREHPVQGQVFVDIKVIPKISDLSDVVSTACVAGDSLSLQSTGIWSQVTNKTLFGVPMTYGINGESTWPGTCVYVSATRTLTINGDYYGQNGTRYSFVNQTLTHANIQGPWFLYLTSAGVPFASQSLWSYEGTVFLKYVWHDTADANYCDVLEERHSATRNRDYHVTQHFAVDGGTRISSKYKPIVGNITEGGSNPVSPTDAGNRPSVSYHQIFDEDIRFPCPAIPDNGPYTIMYYNGTKPITLVSQADVYSSVGGYMAYNNPASGLVALSANKFGVVFGFSKPSETKPTVFIPAQKQYDSYEECLQAYPGQMDLSWFPSQEYVCWGRFTFKVSAAYTTVGKAGLAKYDFIPLTRNSSAGGAVYGIAGTGTAGFIPVWTGTTTIGNSRIKDDGSVISLLSDLNIYYQTFAESWPSVVVSAVADGFNPGIAFGEYGLSPVDCGIVRVGVGELRLSQDVFISGELTIGSSQPVDSSKMIVQKYTGGELFAIYNGGVIPSSSNHAIAASATTTDINATSETKLSNNGNRRLSVSSVDVRIRPVSTERIVVTDLSSAFSHNVTVTGTFATAFGDASPFKGMTLRAYTGSTGACIYNNALTPDNFNYSLYTSASSTELNAATGGTVSANINNSPRLSVSDSIVEMNGPSSGLGFIFRQRVGGGTNACIYNNGITPSATNYAFYTSATGTEINAVTTVGIDISDARKMTFDSTSIKAYNPISVWENTSATYPKAGLTNNAAGGNEGGIYAGSGLELASCILYCSAPNQWNTPDNVNVGGKLSSPNIAFEGSGASTNTFTARSDLYAAYPYGGDHQAHVFTLSGSTSQTTTVQTTNMSIGEVCYIDYKVLGTFTGKLNIAFFNIDGTLRTLYLGGSTNNVVSLMFVRAGNGFHCIGNHYV